ncbi:hypothetical protein [Embleya sp. NPDC059237]|uniref:hypothetical protein n=1 Tax=Embleya sp. NPDC059237 TaxID=3346784 RepID=UPI003674F717
MAPDDVVPIDRNCHKSHHYAAVLAGSRVAYLDSYLIDEFSMYGRSHWSTSSARC